MIALTQEKREELKAFLSASIEKRCTVYTLAKQRELEALRDQITLASIMAQPFGYVEEGAVNDRERLFSAQVFADEEDLPSYEFSELSYPLYLAPPVPEINTGSKLSWKDAFKLLDVNACGEDRITAFMMGAEWRLSEIKRLNGLGN